MQTERLFKVSSQRYFEVSCSGPTFTQLGSILGIRFGSERCSGRSLHPGAEGRVGAAVRPPSTCSSGISWEKKHVWCGSRQSKQPPVCALRAGTASPSPPLQTARPGTWAPAAAAARARALCDPAPAQHFIPRVACCRSHRFPTCARALGPPRLFPQALQDHGVGGPRAGRGIHEALTFTSNANSAYLIPAAPPLLPVLARPFRPGGRKHSAL